jgi:predicted ATPase/DNA-binding SARP family transcriptional activator
MSPPGTELRILGPCELAAGGSPVPLGSLKQRVLLACLVADLNRPVAIDRLIAALWGGAPPPAAETTLRSLVSRLRRLLASIARADGEGRIEIVGHDGAYLLRADPGCLDARRFEDDIAAGRRALSAGDPLEAARCFTAGLARWRGPALTDLADAEEARPEAHRLEEERLAALEHLADAELATGDPQRAQATMESLVAEHPLREAAWGRLMLALYRQGRQADALRVYQRARRLLVEELGVEPGPELRKLEQQVLAHSPELEGPAGPVHNTVAFLFTDIEASTRRWEGDRQAMGADLARHDELLRSEMEQAGGRVFAHTGDGLCGSFPTASAAVAAAVAAQRALIRQPWDAAEPLRVRMAVHAGAAESRGDNWVGPPLNRTARLLSLAAGGQVLCSRAAADLAGDDLPAGVRLRDLGEHRLADLARPEQVFAVEHPDLPAAFPALPGGEGHRTNLVDPMTSFLGRSQELDELDVLLSSARILTITGVGGAGKTRLATELARRCLDRYPDGVWLVQLASLREPAAVTDEVAGALGLVAPIGGRDRLEQLREWLAARRLLMVLDNCEQVVEAVAEFLEAVVPVSPGLSVLATSREVLALPGEVSWAVPPLSLPPAAPSEAADLAGSDAVELFCQRAHSAQPAFALNDDNASAVAQICCRLDGIPLALELAAGRIRVLGAQQLAQRLDDRFRILSGTSRGGAARHHTLQATMDWSWDLLPAREREALRRLSIFPATFDLDAAEAVILNTGPDHGTADAAELVLRLVDKSLVLAVGDRRTMRYRLLETVRDYATARLVEAGEEDAAREAYCEYLLRLSDKAEAEGYWITEERLSCIGFDEAGFLAAIEWSLNAGRRTDALRLTAAHWGYLMFSESVDFAPLLDRCLADPLPAPSAPLVESLQASWFFVPEERGAGAVDDTPLLRAHAMAVELGDGDLVTRLNLSLGYSLIGQGLCDEGLAAVQSAWEHYSSRGRRVPAGWCAQCVGWGHMVVGDLARAAEWFERAVEGVDDRFVTLQAWSGLAMVAAMSGAGEEARYHLDRVLTTARDFPMRRFLMMGLCRATEIGLLIGDEAMAATALDELLVTLREIGALRWVAGALEATVALIPPSSAGEAATLTRLLGAAAGIRQILGEPGLPTLTDQLAQRGTEIAALLNPAQLAAETDRGRQASPDEALRWALAALRSSQARCRAST